MTDADERAKLEYQLAQAAVERARLETQLSEATKTTQLELLKIRTQNSAFIHEVISQLEPFSGIIGDLEHFIKGGEQIQSLIISRKENGTLLDSDVKLLEASLVGRISRRVLNAIQGDLNHSWDTLKVRLKKLYGGGRWTPEEDVFYLLKERRTQGQSEGEFAEKLLVLHNRLTEKMVETFGQAEGAQKLEFLRGVLKVQLNHYMDRPGSLPRDRDFIDCAHDLIDARERKETRFDKSEAEWTEVKSSRRRNRSPPRQTTNHRSFEKRSSRTQDEKRRKPDRRCYECNRTGHLAAQCNLTRCFECGRRGHVARECPKRNFRGNGREPRDEPMEVNNQDWSGRRTGGRRGRHYTSGESSEEESVRSERSGPATRRHEVSGGIPWRGGPSGSEVVSRRSA